MRILRPSRILALATVVVLVAVVTTGCARRGQAGELAGSGAPTPAAVATIRSGTAPPAPSTEPSASALTAAPAGTPVPTPDLTAIESLIKDIDNDLGADAAAAADEGSTP